jgi:hypothetical protein
MDFIHPYVRGLEEVEWLWLEQVGAAAVAQATVLPIAHRQHLSNTPQ